MFDFANSSFTTLISTVAYSAYFRQAVVGDNGNRGDFLWSVATVTAHAILILTSSIMGAAADYSGRKKAFLFLTTAQTVVATALLFLVRPGDVVLGIALYVVAAVGFEGGYIFYNAFLPEVSTPQTIGRISGWSWGTGFIGGLVALVAVGPLLREPLSDPSTGLLNDGSVLDYRLSFVFVALFFALFSVPTFLFLRERGSRQGLGSWHGYARVGFARVADTLRHLREYRETGKFMLATLFFYGGIEAVIKFSAIYAIVTFGISGRELTLLFVVTNLVAVPGTLAAGYAADWLGGKRALGLTLMLWIGVVIFGGLATGKPAFWLMACGAAIGMGSTQAIARTFVAQISPPDRESEFFGFYVLASKVGSIIALLVFGITSSSTGSQRTAVLWLVPLFVIGLLLLWSVDERVALQRGRTGSTRPS
jgi:UMF1 family MFS transporter